MIALLAVAKSVINASDDKHVKKSTLISYCDLMHERRLPDRIDASLYRAHRNGT